MLLPRGASADSLTWDFGRPVTTTVPRSTKVLADGRTWVHEAFSADGILDWQPGGPTVTYTAADGSRVTARVLNVGVRRSGRSRSDAAGSARCPPRPT